jgi:hypothetical protein
MCLPRLDAPCSDAGAACSPRIGSAPPRCRRPARSALPRCRRRLLAAERLYSAPPCPSADAACSPLALRVRREARRRRLWWGFLARFFPLARECAAGSSRCRLKTTAPYNAKPAVEFAWEHERSPSSHDATAPLSLLIYCSERGGFLQNCRLEATASTAVVRALTVCANCCQLKPLQLDPIKCV